MMIELTLKWTCEHLWASWCSFEIWRLPEMGLPPVIIHFFWDFPWNKPSFLGYHHLAMRKNPFRRHLLPLRSPYGQHLHHRGLRLGLLISITKIEHWSPWSPFIGLSTSQFCATHENFGYGNGWNPNTVFLNLGVFNRESNCFGISDFRTPIKPPKSFYRPNCGAKRTPEEFGQVTSWANV